MALFGIDQETGNRILELEAKARWQSSVQAWREERHQVRMDDLFDQLQHQKLILNTLLKHLKLSVERVPAKSETVRLLKRLSA